MTGGMDVAGGPRFACNMDALTDAERAEHAVLMQTLFGAVRTIEPGNDGYTFVFEDDDEVPAAAGRFVALERRCCPFFTFALNVEPGVAPTLVIAGPTGVRPFIEAEFAAALPSSVAFPDTASDRGATAMDTSEIAPALALLFRELTAGAPEGGAYMLNRGDVGLLRSLDALSAGSASARPDDGGASIAAHTEHLRYGLSLMNRWAAGEEPFADADWSKSWEMQTVTEQEWAARRDALRAEAEQWLASLGNGRSVSAVELAGMIGSVAHLAYHLGAMRQIDRRMRGPAAND